LEEKFTKFVCKKLSLETLSFLSNFVLLMGQ